MTVQSQNVIRAFELLPEAEKQEVVVELLKRSRVFESPNLSDEELVGAAETIFLSLDREEATNAQSSTG